MRYYLLLAESPQDLAGLYKSPAESQQWMTKSPMAIMSSGFGQYWHEPQRTPQIEGAFNDTQVKDPEHWCSLDGVYQFASCTTGNISICTKVKESRGYGPLLSYFGVL